MRADIANIVLAFIEGFGLIISPCILPILPIMLAGSVTGGKARPIGIVCGFVIVFAVFTFFSRALVQSLGVNLDIIRYISFVLVALFGVIMISDYLSEKFSSLTQGIANAGARLSDTGSKNEGFLSGLILGGLVSLIWTPCAGPILAAVIVQTAIQKSSMSSFLVLMAFALGSAVPMLLIALFGKKLIGSMTFFKKHARLLRKIFGVIIIATVILTAFSSYSFTINNAAVPTKAAVSDKHLPEANKLLNPVKNSYLAPEFAGISTWINSPPLTMAQLRGKVVLIDFWTYSCINCIRTLPYIKDWYQKYHDKGLVIVGVHTPEFEFEKKLSNVQMAVAQYGIKYPVAIDNNYSTWQNFRNHYWPAHFLINKEGKVVYEHFGEGNYDVTENNIRFLLGVQNVKPSAATMESDKEKMTFGEMQTPETYFGYERAENFSSPESSVKNAPANYTFPTYLMRNHWALQGKWQIASQKIIAKESGAALKLHFYASRVFVVVGTATQQPVVIKVLLNGKPITMNSGKDVVNSQLTVKANNLYEVVKFDTATTGELTLIVLTPGAEFYTFTFG